MVKKKVFGPAVTAPSEAERADVLLALLKAHPELVAEAERLAEAMLEGQDREEVAASVARQLRLLHIRDLADRAGPQWGGGYVDPVEAVYEMAAEVVQPYLDDLTRRVKIGTIAAALEIGLGLLSGLYGCRQEDDNDLALVHGGLPDVVDDLADRVLTVMRKTDLAIPEDWMADECPAWS
ncbi:hypothetical protein [Microtetraspora malaysiensis]|uniref:hypothetical protein n=1 Tax=Microtetraspora malaysiensis TaxID=161358 RepID=UPI003D8AB685